MATENNITIRPKRRPRRRVNLSTQPSPIGLFTAGNRWQVYTQITPQQVNPTPADLFACVVQKAALAFVSLGMDEFIKDLRKPERGETGLDRLGKELFIAFFLEPGKHALAEARGRC